MFYEIIRQGRDLMSEYQYPSIQHASAGHRAQRGSRVLAQNLKGFDTLDEPDGLGPSALRDTRTGQVGWIAVGS